MTPDGRARIAAPPLNLDDPILAQVRGRYVHLSDVAAAARAAGDLETDEALEPRDAFSRGFVDQYVDERLLADAATSVGLSRNPMVARRIRAARDHVLAAAYLDAQIQAASTPETIARLYEQQADIVTRGDEVRARHILVRTEDEAREILAALKDGYDFKKMARERSIDRATAPLGGEIGYFTREMMSPPLSRAAFATPKGDYARLFFTEHGWHILQVVDRRETVRPPLEDFSDQIRRYLELRTLAETLNELRRQNEVVYFRSSLEPPAPSAALTAPVSPEASDGQTVGPRDADAEASTHSQ